MIALFIITCLIILTCLTLFYYRKSPVKEGFTIVDRTLVNSVEDHQRDRFATERCNTLYTTSESLSEQAVNTMTAYIGGHRLQRWKPNRNDPSLRNNPDKDYCYLYGDDVAMQNTKCDMTNPMFKDPQGIITGVFESEYADQTHTIPIKKCVLEIGKNTSSNPTNLDAFWNHMGRFDCDQVTQSIRVDIERTRAQTDSVKRNHEMLFTQYRANSNLASVREFGLNQCSKSNLDYASEYPQLVSQFMTLSERLQQERAAVAQQARDHVALQNNALTMHMQVNDAKRDYEGMKLIATSCTKDLRGCETSKETHLFNYNIMQQANIDLQDNNLVLAEDLNQWTASYYTACNLVQTCSNDVAVQRGLFAEYNRHWTSSNAMYVTCQRERATYSNDATLYMNQFESYSNQLAKCRDDLFEKGKVLVVEQEELAECRQRVAFLQRVIGETEAKIRGLNDEINILNNETNGVKGRVTICQSEVGLLESTIVELEKRRDAMLRELEALNAAANNADKEGYNGQLEIIKNTVEATQRAAELSCQAVKTRASDLRNQITQIKTAQVEAAGMPKINMTATCPSSCTPSRKQCILYKNVYCKFSIVDYRNQLSLWVYYTTQKKGDPVATKLTDVKYIAEHGFPSQPVKGADPIFTTGQWFGIFQDYHFGNDQSFTVETWQDNGDVVEHFLPLLGLIALKKKKKKDFNHQPIMIAVYPAFSVSKEISVEFGTWCDDWGIKGFLDSSLGSRRYQALKHADKDLHVHSFKPGITYQFIFTAQNRKDGGYLTFGEPTGLDELADNLLPPTTAENVIKWENI